MSGLTHVRQWREEARLRRVIRPFVAEKQHIHRAFAKQLPSLVVRMESHVYSVLIPAHNAAAYIGECLASVLEQPVPEGVELEILVGVDGCEATRQAVARFLADAPPANTRRVQVLYFAQTFGVSIMINSLILASRGTTVQILGADDTLAPGALPELIRLATESAALRPDFLIRPIGLFCDASLAAIPGKKPIQIKGALCLSKPAIERLGGFAPWICAADRDLLHRAEAAAIPCYTTPVVTYFYRQHDAQLTNAGTSDMKSDLRKYYWLESERRIRHKQLKEKPLVADPEPDPLL